MFRYFAMVCSRFGAAAASFLSDMHCKILSFFFSFKLQFMLCANLIYSDPVAYILISENFFQVSPLSQYLDHSNRPYSCRDIFC